MNNGGSLNPFDGCSEQDEEELAGSDSLRGMEEGLSPGERLPVDQLEQCWQALDELMQSTISDPFALEEIRENVNSIMKLIIRDKPRSDGITGPCLQYMLSENIVENIYMFSTRQKVYVKDVRVLLLKFFTEVFTRSSQPILIHQQILRPLSRCIRACEGAKDPDLNSAVVQLLHRVCILMQENQSLLDLFFLESKTQGQSRFLVFTQLIGHMHEQSEVGTRARDALLLCLSLADQLPASNLSHFIANDCNFCQVLATGLSALYSELPSWREVEVDDWQSPLTGVETAVPELRSFTQALSFCNSVLQMAPKVVCDTVLALVREGFLQQVLGAALLQSSQDAVVFATCYLTLFLTSITNVALMREFLQYLVTGSYDNQPILGALIQNIASSNHRLSAVTLELFYVLVDLNCEDVMLELILKYLVPGGHVMPNQLAITGAPDVYSQAARKLLQLLPAACINAEKMFLDSIKPSAPQTPCDEDSSPPPPPLLTSSPTVHPHNHLEKPIPVHATKHATAAGQSLNPFDQPALSRSRSGSDASSSSLVSMASSSSAPQTTTSTVSTSTSTVTSVTQTSSVTQHSNEKDSFSFEYISPEVAYMNNLGAARSAINTCASRCKCWTSLYDKCEVSKESLHELFDDGMKRSLEMEDVQRVRVRVTSEEDGEEDFATGGGRFRSRATTVATHSRLARTASAKARTRLRPEARRGEEVLSDDSSEQGPSRSSSRRTGTVHGASPKSSPRFGRKFSDSGRFEDKVGSLLKVLLEKLTDMLELPPIVNMLLTRLISRLAHFPQPLLRSLLLNHQLVLRPGIPNLFLVLQSLKATVDGYARTREGFEKRVGRARKTMIYRAQVRNAQIKESVAERIVSRLMKQSSRADLFGSLDVSGLDSTPPLNKKDSKASLPVTEEEPAQKPRLDNSEGAHKVAGTRKHKRKKISTNTLFAVVIFDEFLRELSALSQEHSALNPLLTIPKSSEA